MNSCLCHRLLLILHRLYGLTALSSLLAASLLRYSYLQHLVSLLSLVEVLAPEAALEVLVEQHLPLRRIAWVDSQVLRDHSANQLSVLETLVEQRSLVLVPVQVSGLRLFPPLLKTVSILGST